MGSVRQQRGLAAETQAAAFVAGLGWRVVARNVKVGRDEIDILAVDPGPPACVVNVEVRSLRASSFGEPEERVDAAKVGRLYRAAYGVRATMSAGERRLPVRVDLVVVDGRSGRNVVRHLRALHPP